MNLCLFHPGSGVDEEYKHRQVGLSSKIVTLHIREVSYRNSSTRSYRTKILKAMNGIRFTFLLQKYWNVTNGTCAVAHAYNKF